MGEDEGEEKEEEEERRTVEVTHGGTLVKDREGIQIEIHDSS